MKGGLDTRGQRLPGSAMSITMAWSVPKHIIDVVKLGKKLNKKLKFCWGPVRCPRGRFGCLQVWNIFGSDHSRADFFYSYPCMWTFSTSTAWESREGWVTSGIDFHTQVYTVLCIACVHLHIQACNQTQTITQNHEDWQTAAHCTCRRLGYWHKYVNSC